MAGKEQQGIQSIEVGVRLLRVLALHGRPMMLRDLAQGAQMPAAKAHRYLVSFVRAELVAQDPATGRYGLGSFAVDVGLAALSRLDPVRLAAPILDDLCEEIGETVALAVWGNKGPTIVRLVEPGGPIAITLRTGTVLPLLNSATGRAFATFHRSPYLRRLLDDEIRAAAADKVSATALRWDVEETLAEIRRHGISRVSGNLTPGINGFSVPVFDHTGAMVAAITSLGAVGMFDTDWEGPVAAALKKRAAILSHRLGHTPIDPLAAI